MSKLKIVAICVCVAVISFIGGYHIPKKQEVPVTEDVWQEEEKCLMCDDVNNDNYLYPQQLDGKEKCISVDYTESILKKKAEAPDTLTSDERDLIIFFELHEDGYGFAVTRWYEADGGMGKATRRFWETSDGEYWNVLSEDIYSVGYHDFTYIDNIVIESTFGSTAEKGGFAISTDRGHKFTYIPIEDVFEYDGVAYPEKISDNKEKKTITYQWSDFHSKELITIIEYDLNLKVLNEIRS